MHGAALSLGAAWSLAVKLCHHFFKIATLRQVVSVAPVGAEHHIIRTQGFANANRDRFLADGKMHWAFDLVTWIDSGDLLLHAPNPIDRPVKSLDHGFTHESGCDRRTSNRFVPNPLEGRFWVASPLPATRLNREPLKPHPPAL